MHGASLTRLSLLGHPLRARVFGLLVRRLPHGMTAGALAQALAVAPSTLSAHLSALGDPDYLIVPTDRAAWLTGKSALRYGLETVIGDYAILRRGEWG